MTSESTIEISPDLPLRPVALALAEALFPANQTLPALAPEPLCDTVAGYLVGHPNLRRALASGLFWLDTRALPRFGKRFQKLSLSQRRQLLDALSAKAVSGNLLRAVCAPFKTAWLLDNDIQQRVNSRPRLEAPAQLEQFRWQQQITDANALEGEEELEADVIVIGTGAGGAAAAYELASRGLAVVMLEEGRYYNRSDFNGSLTELIPKLYRGLGTTVAMGNVAIPVPIGRSVGGTTTINSGTCMRTPGPVLQRWRQEFGLEQMQPEQLEPWFQGVESMLKIQRAEPQYVGEIGHVIEQGARELGLTQFHMLRRNAQGCDGQGLCQFGCPTDAKQSTNVSYVPRALERGAFLFTGFRATRLLHDQQTISGVVAEGRRDDGKSCRLTLRAKQVVVAMGSLCTPLFLKDNGVRNPHLGKHLTIHPAGVVNAVFPERQFANSRTIPQGAGLSDLADEGLMFEGGTVPFIGHGLFSNLYGQQFVDYCSRYQNTAYFGLMIRDTSEGKVRRGPHRDVPWISYRMNRQDFALFLKGIDTLARIYLKAGASEVWIPGINQLHVIHDETELNQFMAKKRKPRDFLMSAYHPLGTARIAGSERLGACDENHQVFGWQGLYVMDGSSVPTSLGANPQVTIMTLAAKAAARLADKINQSQ